MLMCRASFSAARGREINGNQRDTKGTPKGHPRDIKGMPKGRLRDASGVLKGYERDTKVTPKVRCDDTTDRPGLNFAEFVFSS